MYDAFAAAKTRNLVASLSTWRTGKNKGFVCLESTTTWFGVTCDEGMVTSLKLNGRSLKGSFITEIGNLIDLQYLDLSDNLLTGTLPDSLCRLKSNNAIIDFSGNFLSAYPSCLLQFRNFIRDDSSVALSPTGQPTRQPSALPTSPTGQPSRSPTSQPSVHPTLSLPHLYRPTHSPTTLPTASSGQPSRQPSAQPTLQPSRQPVSWPTCRPTSQPSSRPSRQPSNQPTTRPTIMVTTMSEKVALLFLHRVWGGSNLATWIDGTSVCYWQGVGCNSFGAVVSLSLPRAGLVGNLPGIAIESLRFLTSLNLSSNALRGALPSQLGSLPRLSVLDLSSNRFNGSIPWSLANRLGHLKNMNLSSNMLSGTMPIAFCSPKSSSTAVTILDLSSNQHITCYQPCLQQGLKSFLYGPAQAPCQSATIAAFEMFWSAILSTTKTVTGKSSAGTLRLISSILTGWARGMRNGTVCIGESSAWKGVYCNAAGEMTGLELTNLGISGFLVGELGLVTSLTRLSLGSNQFVGTIPTELKALVNLKECILGNNKLIGTISTDVIGSWTALTELDIHSNFFIGSLPIEGFAKLSRLEKLDLSNNQFSHAIPSTLFSLSLLKMLRANNNVMTGSLPREIAQLTSLQHLDLSKTLISGPIPSEIARIQQLTYLSLADTSVSGPLLSDIGSLTKLKTLAFYNTKLTGTIASSLGKLTALQDLFLSGNDFFGVVPDSLCALADTTAIHIKDNIRLKQFPECLLSFGNGSWDRTLNTTNAAETLDGKILCDFFETLSVGGKSKLSNWCGAKYRDGSFVNSPCNIADPWKGISCSNIMGVGRVTSLDLQDKGLGGGSIPASIGGLIGLSSIDLYGNGIQSTIPTTIGLLNRLVSIALDGNSIRGQIPSELGRLSSATRIWLSDNALEGEIPESLGTAASLIELYLHSNKLVGRLLSTLCRSEVGLEARPFYLTVTNNTGVNCVASLCLLKNANAQFDSSAWKICDPPTPAPTPSPAQSSGTNSSEVSLAGIAGAVIGASLGLALALWLHDYYRFRLSRSRTLKIVIDEGEMPHYEGSERGYWENRPSPKPTAKGAEIIVEQQGLAEAEAEAETEAEAEAETETEANADMEAKEDKVASRNMLAPELLGMKQQLEERLRKEMDSMRTANVALREQLRGKI